MWRTAAIVVAFAAVIRKIQNRLFVLERRKANKGRALITPDESSAEVFTLKNPKKIELYCRRWGSLQDAKYAVVMVHGELLDGRHFRPLAEALVKSGCVCYGVDLTGFGKSGCQGVQSHIESFKDYLDDIQTIVSHINSQSASLPLVFCGEDLGSTCGLAYAIDHTIVFAAIVGAGVKLDAKGVDNGVGKALMKVCPSIGAAREKLEYNISDLYDDAEVALEARDNFESLDPSSLQKKTEIAALCDYVKQNASKLQTPLLLLHGKEDQRQKLEAVEQFKEEVGSDKKYLRAYPGERHGFLHGNEAACISSSKDIINFVKKLGIGN